MEQLNKKLFLIQLSITKPFSFKANKHVYPSKPLQVVRNVLRGNPENPEICALLNYFRTFFPKYAGNVRSVPNEKFGGCRFGSPALSHQLMSAWEHSCVVNISLQLSFDTLLFYESEEMVRKELDVVCCRRLVDARICFRPSVLLTIHTRAMLRNADVFCLIQTESKRSPGSWRLLTSHFDLLRLKRILYFASRGRFGRFEKL